MPASKIVDEGEVIRWFEEGRTYAWMISEYERKYNIETVPSMWGNFRRRRGLDRRNARNDELMPWYIEPQHRWGYPARMLRAEARRRVGMELPPGEEHRLEVWKRHLDEEGVVVHYDGATEQGWFYVPRREGVDADLIRKPQRKTTTRKAAD